jgi:hypothetical protein
MHLQRQGGAAVIARAWLTLTSIVGAMAIAFGLGLALYFGLGLHEGVAKWGTLAAMLFAGHLAKEIALDLVWCRRTR